MVTILTMHMWHGLGTTSSCLVTPPIPALDLINNCDPWPGHPSETHKFEFMYVVDCRQDFKDFNNKSINQLEKLEAAKAA